MTSLKTPIIALQRALAPLTDPSAYWRPSASTDGCRAGDGPDGAPADSVRPQSAGLFSRYGGKCENSCTSLDNPTGDVVATTSPV
eukprot:CAMPEP_0194266626 /NCGR_PEP_ID=MMETSP0169-20130528/1475_1 /TAXON_ID=218684 /ORGANISM="Corethron pennatum, Strain L29A3" /LENGTH=84 /DNA_ID=CAMNT_0039007361 /DNA_START=861 /DNA_END=1111 /DNA_ORIENTATION=+